MKIDAAIAEARRLLLQYLLEISDRVCVRTLRHDIEERIAILANVKDVERNAEVDAIIRRAASILSMLYNVNFSGTCEVREEYLTIPVAVAVTMLHDAGKDDTIIDILPILCKRRNGVVVK